MDAKTFFRAIRLERKEIRILNEKIYAREMDLLPSGIRYDKDNIQTSIEDTMTAKLAELGDFEQKRKDLLKTLSARQAQAIEIISRIPDTKQRQVMEIYYFDTSNPTWDDGIRPQMDSQSTRRSVGMDQRPCDLQVKEATKSHHKL